MEPPRISWDVGTAYDMFVSLTVLHYPTKYGLRAAWAAGMRSRIPTDERELLEQVIEVIHLPVDWIYSLPAPKDGATVLRALAELSPIERLQALTKSHMPPGVLDIYHDVAARRAWDNEDRDEIRAACKEDWGSEKCPSAKDVAKWLDIWAQADEVGEMLLSGLQTYYDVFFAEEEQRIMPALEAGLARAQQLAETLEFSALMEELSQGVRLDEPMEIDEAVLIPSFWGAPWLFFGEERDDNKRLFVFGSRPADASLVPGEVVPDALLIALKALSDPTRLKIMRHLVEEGSLNPTKLAHKLRLRAPTVVHHLHTLRAARLVYVSVGGGKRDKVYEARCAGVLATCDALREFLVCSEEEIIEEGDLSGV